MDKVYPLVLYYRIVHPGWLDYTEAKWRDVETANSHVTRENRVVMVKMKNPDMTLDEAKILVDLFLDEWEFVSDLESRPGALIFEFSHYKRDVPDPSPHEKRIRARDVMKTQDSAQIRVAPSAFPSSPSAPLELSAEVVLMRDRFLRYKRGREPADQHGLLLPYSLGSHG